jgi:hypothetical protein
MKYVTVSGLLTAMALWCAGSVTWLVVANIDKTTNYAVALFAMMLIPLMWIPFGISLAETMNEYRAYKRRRNAKRRHPTRRVH